MRSLKPLTLAVIPGAMLVLAWGCAMLPPQQSQRDPFLTVEPGLAPQQRSQPMRPMSPIEPTPGIEGTSRYQPPPRSQPAPRSSAPAAPQRTPPRTTPKTFADPAPKSDLAPPRTPAKPYRSEKRPAPVEANPESIAPPKRQPAPPIDGPKLAPPEAAAPTRPITAASAERESLDLRIEVPPRRPIGSGAPFQVTIRNLGDENVRNVSLVIEFDDALEYPGSDRHSVTLKIPKIESGDAKESRLTLVGRDAGSHRCTFTVNVGSRTVVVKEAVVEFVSRQLDWQLHGPSERTVGSRAEFNIPLINVSRKPLRNLTVRVEHDAALKVREMTRGGKLDDRSVTWSIDELAVDEGLLLQLELECREPTTFACLSASVSGPDLPTDDAEACLAVTALNGRLDVRVQDVSDPVSVGGVAEFIVTIENPGVAAVGNVALIGRWPEGIDLKSAVQMQAGKPIPIEVKMQDQQAAFPTIARLDPDRRVEFRVRLTTRQAGPQDIRFSVQDAAHATPHEVIEPIMVHR